MRARFRPTRLSQVSYYISLVEIHLSARRHGVGDKDIEHAIDNAMSIDDQVTTLGRISVRLAMANVATPRCEPDETWGAR
jgi:hypothetical protein